MFKVAVFRNTVASRQALRRCFAAPTTKLHTSSTPPNSVSNDLEHAQLRLNALAAFESQTLLKTIYNVHSLDSSLNIAYSPFSALHEAFDHKLDNGEKVVEHKVLIAGRVLSKRDSGSKLSFLTVSDINNDTGSQIQIKLSKADYTESEEFAPLRQLLRRGDIVSCHGYVQKTNQGELTVCAERLYLQSCFLLPWQNEYQDRSLLHSQRHLDLMTHASSLQRFQTRSKLLSTIRRYLEDRDYLEVETPILGKLAGGALAEPFATQCRALGRTPLFLRVAPELFLKQLIVGGFSKVFEIGKQFRNEGIDRFHNPEFSTLELYKVNGTLSELMRLTEDLMRHLLRDVLQCPQLTLTIAASTADDTEWIEIDFSQQFVQLSFVDELARELQTSSLLEYDFDALYQHASDLGVQLPSKSDIKHLGKLYDELFSILIEPKLIQPTFVVDYPTALSPLARQKLDNPLLTERFELFINGNEFANAYGELSDPREQLKRFEEQRQLARSGASETMPNDMNFVDALSCGLPPTVGYGLGLDRLFLLLLSDRKWQRNNHGSDVRSLRDVILFPMTKTTSQLGVCSVLK